MLIGIFTRLNKIGKDLTKKIVFLLMLIVFQCIFEVLGILSFIPVINLIFLDANQSFLAIKIFEFINFKNENSYFYLFAAFIVLLNISTYYALKYIFITSENISKNLCEVQVNNYLTNSNSLSSSEIISDITIETYRFTRSVLIPYLNFLSRALCITSILTILLFVSYKSVIALTLLVLFFIYATIKINKKRLFSLGEKIRESNKSRINVLTEILNNFLAIKIFDIEKIFYKKFKHSGEGYANATAENSFVIIKQKFVLECLFFCSIGIGLVFVKDNISQNLSPLSIFLYAFLRTIPHFQACLINYSSAKSHYNSGIKLLNKIISVTKDNQIQKKKFDKSFLFKSLLIKNINYKYSNTEEVIKNSSIRFSRNDKILVHGKSGSGKTTLINIICANLFCDNTTNYFINNKRFSQSDYQKIKSLIGYVPQEPLIFNDSMYFNITLKKKNVNLNYKDARYEEILKKLNLNKIKKSKNFYKIKLQEKGKNLSVGQKQKISLARALYKSPQILIFDETFNSIDKKDRQEIISFLNRSDKYTIICISHHKLENFKFNKKIMIDNKKIKIHG